MAESDAKRRKLDSEFVDDERIAESQDDNIRVETTLDLAHSLHLMEKDVGITECVGKHKGFFAILKRRFELYANHVIIIPFRPRTYRLSNFPHAFAFFKMCLSVLSNCGQVTMWAVFRCFPDYTRMPTAQCWCLSRISCIK